MRRLGILAVLSLTLAACGEPDPNVECRGHGGVVKVNQNGNNINGIICKDGHYADGES